MSQIADLAGEDTPQVYVACGRGPRSSLRVLRHGLEVTEMAVSELPGNPNAVWTVKRNASGLYICQYIVVSLLSLVTYDERQCWYKHSWSRYLVILLFEHFSS